LSSAVQGSAAPSIKQLALGRAHGCSLDPAISGVLCWGDDSSGQASVPTLLQPRAIAAGGDSSCAITSTGVRCWGQLRAAPLGLRDAVLLAVGDAHACALTAADSVTCWGDDSKAQLRVPALRDVHALAAGAHHTCAIAGGAVVCWGDDSRAQLRPPVLEAPEQLAAAGDHSCALAAGTLRCWGDLPDLGKDLGALSQPFALATGPAHVCVLDASGARCAGELAAGNLIPRELTRATQIAVGGGAGFAHACARHLQGVACWGDNQLGQVDYDGEPLHVLHHSEADIAAPAEKVWQVLMDLDRYPAWNPYTIAMRSTLEVGDPMVMTVKMNELLTLEQTEHIRVLEGHKVCWGIDTETPELNSGERCQWLEPLPGGGTRYVTEDLIEGTLNPIVNALFDADVERGFDAVAVALKARVESR
jgi:alpha-tubulin suppressor-like RCC1 family protein